MTKRRTIVAAAVLLAAAAWWFPEDPPPETRTAKVSSPKTAPKAPRFQLGKGRPPVKKRAAEVMEDPLPTSEEAQTLVVHCPIPPEVSEMATVGTARIDTPTGPYMADAHIESGLLSFEVPKNTLGTGEVMLPGWSAAGVYFADGDCQLDPLLSRAYITGQVVATEGVEDDRIMVSGCGTFVRTDSDGSFFAEIDASPCTLMATRRDGRFTMRADPLFLDPLPAEDIDVELVFPPYRAAGVGVMLRPVRAGIMIAEVQPNTPAERSGLRRSDIIIGLDGEPIGDMEVWDFVDLALGPSGSEVVYTVQRDGEPVEINLVRELLD